MTHVESRTSARPDRAFLAFAAVFFVFHQLPSVLFTHRVEAAVDVLTPFAVAASTVAVMLALGASRGPILAAVAAGALYVHGHGAHLAANSIHNEGIAEPVVYFWDEGFLGARGPDPPRSARCRGRRRQPSALRHGPAPA